MNVFISATSGDLKTARAIAKEQIHILQHVPVVQEYLTPDHRSLRDKLTGEIEKCGAVLHIAGLRCGARPTDDPALSWTQLEYAEARRLRKPTFVFIADKSFPFDQDGEPEDEASKKLQLKHREALMQDRTDSPKYEVIHSMAELREKVLAMAPELIRLKSSDVRKQVVRHPIFRIVTILLLGLLAHTVYAITNVTPAQNTAKKVKEAVEKSPANSADKKTAYKNAVEQIAKEQEKKIQDVAKILDLYRQKVKSDPDAQKDDLAVADFLQQFSDYNMLLATAPETPDPKTPIDPETLKAASKVLYDRENLRNSFGAGLAGPVTLVMKIFAYGLMPDSTFPHPPRKTVTESGFHSPPVGYGKMMFKDPPDNGEKPSSDSQNLFSLEHWSFAVEQAWYETWGVGAGAYRIGFIISCLIIINGMKKVSAPRQTPSKS